MHSDWKLESYVKEKGTVAIELIDKKGGVMRGTEWFCFSLLTN